MIPYTNDAAAWRERFELTDGQIAHTPVYKNLWWELDGHFFGYGDLSAGDILKIRTRLTDEEVFTGWNEHHQTRWQQTGFPMIRIKKDDIQMRGDIIEEERLLKYKSSAENAT